MTRTRRHMRRSEAVRHRRWREQAARLIDDAVSDLASCRCEPSERAYLRGCTFDVALVREHCQRLIAEADDLDAKRLVFADWTREQGRRGMGPENRDRGAFVRKHAWCSLMTEDGPCFYDLPCPHHGTAYADTRIYDSDNNVISGQRGDPCVGGWPGKLARDYAAFQRAKHRCSRKECDGGVLLGDLGENMVASLESAGHVTLTGTTDGGCGVACPECERFAATRMPRTFANGGNLRRAAQRLLATLDGRCPWAPDAKVQPGDCDACKHIEFRCAQVELVEEDGVTCHRASDSRTYALTRNAAAGLDVFGSGCVATATVQARGPAGSIVKLTLQDQHVSYLLSEEWTTLRIPVAQQGMTEASLRITATHVPCSACNGTGHNLRGVLPPLPEETQRRLHATRSSTAWDATLRLVQSGVITQDEARELMQRGTVRGVPHDIVIADDLQDTRAEDVQSWASWYQDRHQSGNDNP